MIRHIIAIIAGALTVAAILYMARLDSEVHRLQMIQEIIAKSKQEVKLQPKVSRSEEGFAKPSQKQKPKSQAEEKLKVLKEKAGRISAFEVSEKYRRNCASCHGINGEGVIGPKLVGKSKDEILQALHDFKSGKRKNYVMYGLLQHMSDADLEELASEIAGFAQKLKTAK